MMFGNPVVRFDMLDGQIKLSHIRHLHKVTEAALLEFPFQETERFVGTITSEPWDEPVSQQDRQSYQSSNSIKARVMARFHRQSTLSTAFAVFEFALIELAVNFRKELSLVPNPDAIKDRGIKRAKKLVSDAGHSLALFESANWKECLDIAEVRNKVMHTASLARLDEIPKFAKIKGIYFEDFADGTHLVQICVDGEYVLRALRIFEDLIEMANQEVEGILNANP